MLIIAFVHLYRIPIYPGNSKPSYIYFIGEQSQGRDTGYYKIGKTKDLAERLENLQTGNPRKLYYCYKWPVTDAVTAERIAHSAMAQYVTPDGGSHEWFFLGAENVRQFLEFVQKKISHYIKY